MEKILDKACKVKVVKGNMFLCDPEGNILPHQIMGRVTDIVDEIPVMMVKLIVDIRGMENKEKDNQIFEIKGENLTKENEAAKRN